MALAPKPWSNKRFGFVFLFVLGAQQCIVVPSPSFVVIDLNPAVSKEYL